MKKSEPSFFQRYPLIKHLLYMIAVSIGILIIVFICIKLYARQGKEYELPDVTDKSIVELSEDNALDLEFVILDSVYTKDKEGGIILMQEPKPGTMIKKGRKVYITLTAYTEEDAVVPDVISMTLRPAISHLENSGLRVNRLRFTPNPHPTDGLEDEVLSISCCGRTLAAGDNIAPGSKIDMVIGTGDVAKLASVPMVLGKTSTSARKLIHSNGLNIRAEHYDRGSKNSSRAVVYRQEPSYTGMATHQMGAEVELWYRNMSQAEIDKMIREFRVDSSLIQSNEALDDSIQKALSFEFAEW